MRDDKKLRIRFHSKCFSNDLYLGKHQSDNDIHQDFPDNHYDHACLRA